MSGQVAHLFLAAGVWVWGPRALWLATLLVGAILLGAVTISIAARWRKALTEPCDPPSAREQLVHFQESYDRGELSQAEFERIRTTLEKQLRAELDLPARKTPADPPAQSLPG